MGRLFIIDSKASGVNGGGFTTGDWRKRDLNTILRNTISATLSSSQITLPAGTYIVRASAPGCQIGAHQTRFYNITDASITAAGTSEYVSSATYLASNRSFLSYSFTIVVAKVFEFQHRCNTTRATYGMGYAVGSGENEVYAIVEIIKTA